MPALLSAEWLALQQAGTATLPEHPGASATMGFQVTGGPDGDVVFTTELVDGRIASNGLGAADDADFTMTMPWATFVAVVDGSTSLDVGFMQGRIKVTGDLGRMLSVLPVTTSVAWREAMAEVAAATD